MKEILSEQQKELSKYENTLCLRYFNLVKLCNVRKVIKNKDDIYFTYKKFGDDTIKYEVWDCNFVLLKKYLPTEEYNRLKDMWNKNNYSKVR